MLSYIAFIQFLNDVGVINSPMEKVSFLNSYVILREYDFESDPEKLVKYLFDKMNSKEGVKELRKEDKIFREATLGLTRFVAEIEGELHATITVEQGNSMWTEHRFRLFSIVTSLQYHGTGLSQLLFQYVKEWIIKQNGNLILVETWEDNKRACSFYEKLGFKQYGCLPNGLKNRNGTGYVNEILYVYACHL